ncbi:MAG: hypothetical protein JWR07_735, partial [Nevskia sp.]|nr:hypothetical protein [Nevskia sp.]
NGLVLEVSNPCNTHLFSGIFY